MVAKFLLLSLTSDFIRIKFKFKSSINYYKTLNLCIYLYVSVSCNNNFITQEIEPSHSKIMIILKGPKYLN